MNENVRMSEGLVDLMQLSMEIGIPARALEIQALDGNIPSVVVDGQRRFSIAAVRDHLQTRATIEGYDGRPATIRELKAGCPDAPSEFILEQIEKGNTIDQAKTEFIFLQSA